MQSFIQIESPNYLKPEELSSPADWKTVFGNDRPLALEIGCGVGDFILKTALDEPDTNFIAIDFYNKGCWKSCRRLDKHGVSNVRVLRDEARLFVTERIAKGSLSAVYINCPDPWPKKRHRKRRLVNREFVEFMLDYLVPGGDFFFATDFDDYGIDVAQALPGVERLENQFAPDLYRHDFPGYHLSKYMRKFMAEGKQIYFVHYKVKKAEG
ncbi:tRNA (guanosine(46)-N7)-methyltransferase TrmB [Geomesophilobacter sediminis]|uniref:tRNA (guanine-N(7)-)-methyltransferase n=1 Tax=Geomesophilobacter sediminis TaxID=2798584 RepID=A0A8J7IYN4_9BACT|nr:tRNA (guanosine(46)-N7)-methyltransferase TrmB [Geomesophilobacter sediminis]MBJ6725327.1 tRNA (guanosine(46)-N7)-methyltransferase TrmB [Geomesophilobacter sediminis]